ncbi:hypothetical protein M569_07298, partial [Genlisea aurea]
NIMLAGCANSGRVAESERLFHEIPKKSSVTWSALLSAYCKIGCEYESFRLLYEMQREGYKPSQFTLGSILRLCSINGLLHRAQQLHCYAVKACFDSDVFVVSALIDVYAKCLCIAEAAYLFDSITEGRNHVTWTAMINGYSLNGDSPRAIQCFAAMRAESVDANQYTFPGVLASCGAVSDHDFGRQVHGCILRGGFAANVFVRSALVDMYSKCGDLRSASKTTEETDFDDDPISYNALIHGCVKQGDPTRALSLFKTMHSKGMELDEFTYPSAINSLAVTKDAMNGGSIHALVLKSGFEGHTLVCNALIDMHSKHRNLDGAFKLFDSLVGKDLISWTSLVTGCALNAFHEEALELFCEMRKDGNGTIQPDAITVSSCLSSCAELALLNLGQQVQANYSVKSGLETRLSVNNSLVSLYGHCGASEQARRVFDSMEDKNVVSWTALIMGYAQNGEGWKSLQLYREMTASGVKPDFITFIGLLFACGHAGLVERGRYYFNSMAKDYGITPCSDHYACMVDLLGRSGKLDEAEELIDRMSIEPDAAIWKSLLGACRIHGNVDLAKKAAAKLSALEPRDSVAYVMLANMCVSSGKWQDAALIRSQMKSRGIVKEPGRSWLEVKGTIHTFVSEDRMHPEAEAIFSKVDEMLVRIEGAGYSPDTSFVLHDIDGDDDGKKLDLAHHSEKLAVAFGILRLPPEAPIRVYKNIRVCGDCHSAMKFVSDAYRRHIVLRDSNRFHHFRNGDCSCGDYW